MARFFLPAYPQQGRRDQTRERWGRIDHRNGDEGAEREDIESKGGRKEVAGRHQLQMTAFTRIGAEEVTGARVVEVLCGMVETASVMLDRR